MRTSMAVLVGAGVGLGGLDMLIGGSVFYALPWVGVAALGAFFLWLRYGRTYESEVIAVSVFLSPGAPPTGQGGTSSSGTASLLWSVGRIRSVAFSGVREAVAVVDCPVSLMETLVRVIRRFESDVN